MRVWEKAHLFYSCMDGEWTDGLCPDVLNLFLKTVPYAVNEPLCVMERDNAFLQTLSEEQYNSFTYMNVVLTEPVWKLYKRDILPAIEIQDRHFLDDVLDGAFSFDVDKLDAPFMKPCLIIVGKQDTEVGYKDQFRLLEKYPNATYCALNKAGHNLQIEQPELFQSIVKNWLKDNE